VEPVISKNVVPLANYQGTAFTPQKQPFGAMNPYSNYNTNQMAAGVGLPQEYA